MRGSWITICCGYLLVSELFGKTSAFASNRDIFLGPNSLLTKTRQPKFPSLPSFGSAHRNQVHWKSAATSDGEHVNRVDQILSQLTTCFPIFVLAAAVLASVAPQSLLWVNRGSTVTIMLAAVMCGTGLTLQSKDFLDVWEEPTNRISVPLGVLCQFAIMPLSAWLVGRFILHSNVEQSIRSALYLGLCLVGSSPGGTASNLVSLIAKADVALSVILTSCSTMAAVVLTPLLVKLLINNTLVQISGLALCTATAKVVLLPVLAGMFLKSRTPRLADKASRYTPFASVVLVSLICGGVVAQSASLLSSTSALPMLLASVLGLHSLGFAWGYLIPKTLGVSERSSRTMSIEVGMQNSALAVVLARSISSHPAASLPGALSATVHSCLGSLLAAYWRLRSNE